LWNARSLNKKSASICEFTELVISKPLDILAITETWGSSGSSSSQTEFNTAIAEITNTLQGYEFTHLPRPSRGGGVGVPLRKGFRIQENQVSIVKSLEYMNVSLSSDKSDFRLIIIHQPPPSKKNKLTPSIFFSEFSTLLESLTVIPEHLLVAGDFNFHVDDSKERNAAKFIDLVESAGLQQWVTGPTHQSGYTLDLLLDRQDQSLILSSNGIEILSDMPSDHWAFICTVDLPRPRLSRKEIKHRKLRKIASDSFRNDLVASPLFVPADANMMADRYNAVLRELLDKHAPEKTRYITLRPNAPWISNSEELRALKQEKRKRERRFRSSGLEILRQLYQEKCQEYKTALDKAKTTYYSTKIQESDSNELFHMIDGLFKVKSVSPLPSHDSLVERAEIFNEYFNEKIKKLRDSLSNSVDPTSVLAVSLMSTPCSSVFSEFAPVSKNFITDLVDKAPAKSCCLDPVPTHLLKQHMDLLVSPITNIVNESLGSGVFPTSLKEGLVHPSFKKSATDYEDFACNRPVTNIAFLSNLLERVVALQTRNYLLEKGLLPLMQSAYRQHYSIETALLWDVNNIPLAIDSKQDVVLILLDLSSAFDTIDHALLIDRLRHHYGFDGRFLEWYRSYLSGRSQKVVVRNTLSSSKPLMFGVPQGSVLGPLLFSMYFAPLEEVIRGHDLDCMMYADDTQLYIRIKPGEDPFTSLAKLELCIKVVITWCESNGLVCNPSKTEVVHFTSRFAASEPIPSVSVNGTLVIPVNSARSLGVVLDRHPSPSSQVNNVCKYADDT